MDKKAFPLSDFKFLDGPGQEGQFAATFATFNVIDRDGDVTMPGAFKSGQRVRLADWGHNWGEPAIGKGVIYQDTARAWVEGQFNLKMVAGREAYESVKFSEDLQEWSYGFDVTKWSVGDFGGKQVRFLEGLDVFETSPVMLAAGMDTGTDAIKSAAADTKAAIPPKGTATTDAAWDGPANEARLSTDAGAATYRQAYAWVDPDKDPDTKAAYKFIHHMVSGDGNVGAANIKACITGVGVLNGGRGGTQANDRDGIYRHLAKHIKDSGADAPPLKSLDDLATKTFTITLDDPDPTALGAALSYAEHLELVAALADVLVAESKAVEERSADRQAYRAKEGRTFSQRTSDVLRMHAGTLHDIGDHITSMLDDPNTVDDYASRDNRPAGDVVPQPKPNPKKDGIAAWAEAQLTLMRLEGLVTA